MPTTRPSSLRREPDLAFVLLAVLLVACCLAGGASRADVIGQVVVRAVAWLALIVAILAGLKPDLRGVRPIVVILSGAVVLVLVQLIPLPPAVWQSLPGRSSFIEAAAASGQAQPWRPWAIVPGAAVNAASSLVVPAAVLVLMAGMSQRTRAWVPGFLLGIIFVQTLVGLLQFSGVGFDNPFVNDTPGQVSGLMANRNHFALLLAMGCLIIPAWAFLEGRRPHWRGPLALGLLPLLLLAILASGSRAGTFVGLIAAALALVLARSGLKRELRRAPSWAFAALVATLLVMLAGFILISVAADRAESINRAITINTDDDMRSRAFPTVIAMVKTYFPAGAGFGGFDPLFRLHEPFTLLKPTYFNHAHNDFVEIVLDGGLAGLLLLLASLGWWLVVGIRAWRIDHHHTALARLGAAMVMLILIASVVDYPARTPIIMAMIAIAADWMARGAGVTRGSALPKGDHLL